MASTNQSPQYQKAEAMFLQAKTNEEKLKWLEEMIRECPKHKSAESMLANLKTRRKKLLEKLEKSGKSGKGGKPGIKKEDMQAVIVGFTNSGKSSLLSLLTNATPEIAPYYFTTKTPVVGMMKHSGTNIQLIEIPAMSSEYYDSGLVNTADVILIVITDLANLEKILPELNKAGGKRLIVFNIKDGILDIRKIESALKSKKLNFHIINVETGLGILELKEKIFQAFNKIRIYTKEPGKEKSNNPLILNPDATVREVADKIFRDASRVRETKIWGPSSKFPGQKVGLQHQLKDLDVVEFKTR